METCLDAWPGQKSGYFRNGSIGSRYACEKLDYVPRDADFVTQTNPAYAGQRDYYWWIRPELFPGYQGVPPDETSGAAPFGSR